MSIEAPTHSAEKLKQPPPQSTLQKPDLSDSQSDPAKLLRLAEFDPGLLTSKAMLQLQSIIGNQATQRMLSRGPVSRSAGALKSSSPNSTTVQKPPTTAAASPLIAAPVPEPMIQTIPDANPAANPPALSGVVDRVEFTASHALTAYGGDLLVNPVWTPGSTTHAAAYTRNTNPIANVSVTLTAPPASPNGIILRGRTAANGTIFGFGNANVANNILTATFPLNGLPGNIVFGFNNFPIYWEVSVDNGTSYQHLTDSGNHRLYWLAGNPIDTLYSLAASKATGYATLDPNPATAIRNGIHGEIPYNPADSTIQANPLEMYAGGGHVCADFANLMAFLARSIGLSAFPRMYYGGIIENGVMIWVSNTGDSNTIHHVQPGDHTFTYHAIGDVSGTEHDAALNRIGIQAQAILAGLNILLTDLSPSTTPAGTVGTPYNHALERQAKTVALQTKTSGPLIDNLWFQSGFVISVPSGHADPYIPPFVLWSVTVGALPNGISLDNTGLLSGTPNAAGNFNFTIQANVFNRVINTKALHMTVNNPPVPPHP